jgi:putative ABC transport system permease protein
MFDAVTDDVRYAWRRYVRSPGFTAVAVLTLAIGIGVNAAVFTVVSAVITRGFRGVEGNDRLLYFNSERNGRYSGVSYPDLEDWRAQVTAFQSIGAAADLKALCGREDEPEVCSATRITANTFRLLGRQPVLGRDFDMRDEAPGAQPVAILSYRFWVRRFDKNPSVIGKTIPLRDVNRASDTTPVAPTTVVGVMPEGFAFPQNQDLWVPLAPTGDLQRRDDRSIWFAFGRLTDTATSTAAQSELNIIARRLAQAYPVMNDGQAVRVQTFTEFFVGPDAATMYTALLAAVGFVLLIACANIANLLLTRAATRTREMAIRSALGAARWRTTRLLVIESLLLVIVGGVFGWGLARWSVDLYSAVTGPPEGAWNAGLLDYTVDIRVLAYLAAIGLGATVACGLAPSLAFLRLDVNAALQERGSGTTNRHGHHLSRLLVMAEVAFAVLLLSGAALMVRSFVHMLTANIGARPAGLAEMLLRLPSAKYASSEQRVAFYQRLQQRIESLPGIESMALGVVPAAGMPARVPYEVSAEGARDARVTPTAVVAPISENYFRTIGTPLLAGRDFSKTDAAASNVTAIVNLHFANEHWRGAAAALGKRIRIVTRRGPSDWLTVVGVAGDVVYDQRRQEIAPTVYVPGAQRSTTNDPWVLVRAKGPVDSVIAPLRRAVNDVEPEVVVWQGPWNVDARLSAAGQYGSIRNNTALMTMFAVIGLLLASIGLYGVLSNVVSQRTREIGIRTALGASARDIQTLVFGVGFVPVAIGLTIGLMGAAVMTPVLQSQLVNVSPLDPVAFSAATGILAVAAALGCLLPARRALRCDPQVVLRDE